MDQIKEMARIAYRALEDKKGENISVIDISGISPLADYFIITNGTSDSQVQALLDNVEEKMHKAGHSQIQREWMQSGNWVLLD
ncbi:MAG: ribosome silencing factor, partial [Lachnospiraceae bacterium]|nr:ribosome silencing factor [Lachnospiraceae bacterium]